jgi:SAM-dependent methyltransferase
MRINHPQVEIEHLAAIISESMAAQQDGHVSINAAQTVPPEDGPPQLRLQPDFKPRADHRYHINDLLQYHGRLFVQAAYRAILKRSPDDTELLRELKRLQSGDVNKIDLLAGLRFSPEGRAKKVRLDGLALPAVIRRLGHLPLLGYFIRLGIAFLRLPNLIRNERQFAGFVLAQHEQIEDFINLMPAQLSEVSRLYERLSTQLQTLATAQQAIAQQRTEFERAADHRLGELDQRLREMDQRFESASADIVEVNKRMEHGLETERTNRHGEVNQLAAEQQRLAGAQAEMETEIASVYLQLQHARSELTIHGRNISAIAAGHMETSGPAQPVTFEAQQFHVLYAALEDRFRGTRNDIKERFKLYLPYVKDQSTVVDLGCGRGEWLEILSEADIKASGVDTNSLQVEQCHVRGLNVREEDLITYLRSLSNESVGAVTGFHIIEHLPFDTLITLLSEALRVLRPGGIVIFETPNPENVLVASNYFYLDPTHRHPVPSELMEFLLKNRGFHKIEIIRLRPWESARVTGNDEITERFNNFFYGPMDYAILGWKVGQ